jgi:four helix bundle protein
MDNSSGAFAEELRLRTRAFTLEVSRFYRTLPKTDEGRIIGNQLLRSGMSVGANFRAVTRARSSAEFLSKLTVVIEEADETLFWLEAVAENGILPRSRTEPLLKEADELVRILAASQRTARRIRTTN